ncbi:hypothetical protein BC830DRAFT_1078246 [Chytriomyces sp. MP71]|nr:hypothetical protein BC830DRAFT_1078246 [Chytriomyces sp. MP71]
MDPTVDLIVNTTQLVPDQRSHKPDGVDMDLKWNALPFMHVGEIYEYFITYARKKFTIGNFRCRYNKVVANKYGIAVVDYSCTRLFDELDATYLFCDPALIIPSGKRVYYRGPIHNLLSNNDIHNYIINKGIPLTYAMSLLHIPVEFEYMAKQHAMQVEAWIVTMVGGGAELQPLILAAALSFNSALAKLNLLSLDGLRDLPPQVDGVEV